MIKNFLKLIFFGISKGPGAEIVLPETGDRDVLRIGFNFQFLLFSGLFGLPLFLKGMWKWAWTMFALCSLEYYMSFQKMKQAVQITSYADLLSFDPLNDFSDVIGTVTLILAVILGFKGNEWRARKMLRAGWCFVNPEAPMSQKAAKTWKLSIHYMKKPKIKDVL